MSMPLLLTIVSVLCGWVLLTLLVLALLMIYKPLQAVNRSLEKIAMGVRAIEQETSPLANSLNAVSASLNEAAAQLGRAARGLTSVDEKFAYAGIRMRHWFGME